MTLMHKFHTEFSGKKRFNTEIYRHFWPLLAHGPFQSLHAACLPLPKSALENSIHRIVHGRQIGRVSEPIPHRNKKVAKIFYPLDGGRSCVRCHDAARQNSSPSARRCGALSVVKEKLKKSLQHPVFPSGHPSKYWPGPTQLIFRDRTGSGAFYVVWSQAKVTKHTSFLWEQKKIQISSWNWFQPIFARTVFYFKKTNKILEDYWTARIGFFLLHVTTKLNWKADFKKSL